METSSFINPLLSLFVSIVAFQLMHNAWTIKIKLKMKFVKFQMESGQDHLLLITLPLMCLTLK